MSLILATGSNLGNREKFLKLALDLLQDHFELMAASKICESMPVDFLQQGKFLNQVLEFKLPSQTPHEILRITQNIEQQIGRKKIIPKGPRQIDIDIIFCGDSTLCTNELTLPHPNWKERSFVILPLMELPYFLNNLDVSTAIARGD